MTKQLINIAITLAVLVGMALNTAMAQDKINNGFAPIGFYTGMETAPGTVNMANSMNYGNTVVLNSFGEWESRHLTISLDYLTNSFYPGNYIVKGGSWSLVVFRENLYAGSLYGKIQTGSVNLIGDDQGKEILKELDLNLQSTGGLGLFEGREETNVSGVCDLIINLQSKETGGNVSFSF